MSISRIKLPRVPNEGGVVTIRTLSSTTSPFLFLCVDMVEIISLFIILLLLFFNINFISIL